MLIEIWQDSDNKIWQHPSARGPSGEVGYPPHRLRGASRPAEIQWQSSIKISERPIRQSGVRGAPGGVFTRPQAGAYEANRRIAAALRPSGLLCRRGQSNPRVRGWVSPGRLRLEASWLRVQQGPTLLRPRPAMGESALHRPGAPARRLRNRPRLAQKRKIPPCQGAKTVLWCKHQR